MTKSKIFLYFCLAFVAGIALSSFIFIPQLFLLGFLIAGIFLISLFWEKKKMFVLGFCALFFVLGIWRDQLAESKIVYPKEGNVDFVGMVADEPDIRQNSLKLTIKPIKNVSQLIEGKILATISRYSEYQYGDKLRIAGKLQTPYEFAAQKEMSLAPSGREDFNYRDYLAKEGIYSVMYMPKIELLEREHFSFYGGVLRFKERLRESIYRNLSPPQSSLLGAIILGDKRQISDELKIKLNVTGVRHITAVSGLHVAILSSILMAVFLGLRLGRKAAFYSTITFLVFFIAMTGFQASAIRAGIMGGSFLLAKYLGRVNASSRTIVFAATLMLVKNPLLLKLDIGFQLSFLAMMGIIYFLPIFKRWIKIEVLAMTLAAQVFTLPILIYNFGYMSLVAPITNILIVPLLAPLMGMGFVFGLAGIVFQSLGWILSWPAWLLLTYLIKIVGWFSSFSFASLAIKNLHWAWLIVSYLFLGYIALLLNKKRADFLSPYH